MAGSYCNVHQVLQGVKDYYYKVLKVLKVWPTLLQSVKGITKCDSYYKMRGNITTVCF